MPRKSRAKPPSPFLRFNSSPELIRLVVLMYVRFPASLRNVEGLLFEGGIDLCHLWTPRKAQAENWVWCLVGCCHLSGLLMQLG